MEQNTALNLEIEKIIFAKTATQPFGMVCIEPKGFVPGTPVTVVLIYHGKGECGTGSLRDLQRLANHGMFYVNAENPSLFGACCKWPLVFVLVQTTWESKFANGEIPYSQKFARERYNMKGKPCALGISLGGFALLNYGNGDIERCSEFFRMFFDMPGGDGFAGPHFPHAAVSAKLECWFVHAIDDEVAKPEQSIKMDREINQLGGTSLLVLYEDGGHTVTTRPFNAYYPWSMINNTTAKVTPESDIPEGSIFEWFTVDQGTGSDKLLYSQGIYQRPDGTVYARQLAE